VLFRRTARRADSTAVVHIGCEKTGSSAIQLFLRTNRDALARQGVCVSGLPANANHIALAAYGLDTTDAPHDDLHALLGVTARGQAAFRRGVRKQLAGELATHRTVVLSSEHLSSRIVDVDERQRITDLFERLGCGVRVIVYLRRPVDLIQSRYSTAIRVGYTVRSMGIDRIPNTVIDYVGLLDRWRADFGDAVNVVVYQEEWRHSVDHLPRAFCELAGIPWSDTFEVPERLENRSLGRGELELMRLLNVAAQEGAGIDTRLAEAYANYAEDHVRTPPYRMPTEEREHIWQMWMESQGALANLLPAADWEYLSARPEPVEAPGPETLDLEHAQALGTLIAMMRERQ